MKKLLTWVKANPVVMLSIVLTAVALGGLTYAFLVRQSYIKTLDQWDAALFQPIQTLGNTIIELPPATPGAPPTKIHDFVTPGIIEHRKTINAAFASQKATVFEQVQTINNTHRKLSPAFQNGQMLKQALSDLRAQVIDMFGPPGSGAPDLPHLGAGMPPAANERDIVNDLNNAAITYERNHRLPPSPTNPSPFQAQRYQQNLQDYNDARSKALGDKLFQALQNKAKSIRIYGVPRPDWTVTGAPMAVNPLDRQDFPVDLTAINPERFIGPPPLGDVWEAQMQVLCIQDILTAISRANRSTDPQSNVLTAPVKQILKLKVYSGYVTGQPAAAVGAGAVAPAPVEAASMMGGAPSNVTAITSEDPPGLTGRQSGAKTLYDVKHASLSVIVDYQSLPRLFQALAEVNFMTVIKVQVSDVDEYEALRKGFVYGSQDCVRVDLLIECIWFRNWMVLPKGMGGMPEDIQQGLSISN